MNSIQKYQGDLIEDPNIAEGSPLTGRLQDLGLKRFYPEQLSLSSVLEIGMESVTDEPAQSHSSLPWIFLKRLMMANVTARSVRLNMSDDSEAKKSDTEWDSDEENLSDSNNVNPLDIITALYLCSDPFLQQEMALKMSLCQFSIPLLLPNCDTKLITFMLWTMRDIVKRFRPHSLTDTRGFVEERIVGLEIPMVSFVRLGRSSLSKSQILNMLLSNDTFVHHNMQSGDALRRISNGLVEISWYLPCGNKSTDIFPEPVAVANLRGDISEFETQYCFLCQTSAAVFVFMGDVDNKYILQHPKSQLFLVGSAQSSKYDDLKKSAKKLTLKRKNVIFKDKQNDATFIETLRSMVTDVITNNQHKMTLESMTTVSNNLGIRVDEDTNGCQNAKTKADLITSQIQDIQEFKKQQLPLQGDIWKELARVEKEMCRLRKAGNQDIEKYKSDLKIKEKKLRQDQQKLGTSGAMTSFISAISGAGLERSYFLKWMRMNLDNLSRKKLSALREQYKEKCQRSTEKNKEEIRELDKMMSECSLGIEIFFREMGQMYESTVISGTEASHKQMLVHCAELLLEGFPIELVDGDAANIPMRWIKDVLTQLNDLVKSNKMLVVAVLGIQSTGKSTLLNTMFGVQFAVSSGRCTRGAFMMLIRLKDDMKSELNCDFLLIIDTEGLKSIQLAQLDYSYEHDNELATLVVGLSDVTIINIAMENSTEMKDVLQIVVHAFLRMKEIGKRPRCLFVHQNVADVSAHDMNMKDRKMLLEQLNEMTQAASRMENKEEDQMFTDVMRYDPETDNSYVPGLWHGTPPMSPVSSGYSEAVTEFKKRMISVLKESKTPRNTVMDFHEWTDSLWRAVKFENFIFSFRNSLVADAYRKVCTEFNKWEWKFRKDMHTWLTTAETSISNVGKFSETPQASDIQGFLAQLKTDADTEFDKGERYILDNVSKYYKKTDCNVELIEKYRADFENSAISLKKELQASVTNRINRAATLREGMIRLESIKKNHTSVVEKRVLTLLQDCRKSKSGKSEQELRLDFEKMWIETVNELSFEGLKKQDIIGRVSKQVWNHLNPKGSAVAEDINKVNLNDYGLKPFTVTEGQSWRKAVSKFWHHHSIEEAQKMSDKLIENCKHLVAQCTLKNTDYDDTYISEILEKIDETISMQKQVRINKESAISLKLHVCANAARDFQTMHDSFIKNNDPRGCLEENKVKYWTDFKDVFHEQDQSQKKADEFTSSCLKPAIKNYLAKFLGQDIVDEVLFSKGAVGFSSRTSFQYSLLKQLLDESNFNKYVSYIRSYEMFVKNWIYEQISIHCPEDVIFKLQEKRLTGIMTKITEAISEARKVTETTGNIKDVINKICTTLQDHLTIPNDTLINFFALNTSKPEPFVEWLLTSVGKLKLELLDSLKTRPVKSKLESAEMKPEDELFIRMFGCGHQCPFCRAPCEAGGKEHEKHFATIHRPEALAGRRFKSSQVLEHAICSTKVVSNNAFFYIRRNSYHPYRNYRDIFPDWHIQPDSSIEATDYWKYLMATFSEAFAKEYKAKPADIPAAWKDIKKEDAYKALKETYNMK